MINLLFRSKKTALERWNNLPEISQLGRAGIRVQHLSVSVLQPQALPLPPHQAPQAPVQGPGRQAEARNARCLPSLSAWWGTRGEKRARLRSAKEEWQPGQKGTRAGLELVKPPRRPATFGDVIKAGGGRSEWKQEMEEPGRRTLSIQGQSGFGEKIKGRCGYQSLRQPPTVPPPPPPRPVKPAGCAAGLACGPQGGVTEDSPPSLLTLGKPAPRGGATEEARREGPTGGACETESAPAVLGHHEDWGDFAE